MTSEQILVDAADGVLTLTLNRPDRGNAFTEQMMEELLDAFDRVDDDDSVRAVVLTGAGRHFCVGADLAKAGDTFERTPDFKDRGGRVTLRMFRCLKPIVAAVNGSAVGVGASLVLASDVRLASESAKFGFVFARRGITLDGAASWFLPRAVGVSQALEWSMSGRVFDVAEAFGAGLVRAPVPQERLLDDAVAMARSLTGESAPVSVALIRQMLWRLSAEADPEHAHEIESRSLYARGKSADAREGVESFVERREATFKMRVSTDLPDFFPW